MPAERPSSAQAEGLAGAFSPALAKTGGTSMEPPRGRGQADELSISTIGPEVVVTGTIVSDAQLRIDGRVVGDAICSAIFIGEEGTFAGRIYAGLVEVSGQVEGAIQANDLIVESKASIIADISYLRLRVASGGRLEGELARRPPRGPPGTCNLRLIRNSVIEGTSCMSPTK